MPVNKHGRQDAGSVEAFNNAFASDVPIVTFPAGLCSRRRRGVVRDLEWKPNFVKKAAAYGRDVVPVYFNGRLSDFFYRLSNLRTALGIKANIEMLYLADEMFRQAGSDFEIIIGRPIPSASLLEGRRRGRRPITSGAPCTRWGEADDFPLLRAVCERGRRRAFPCSCLSVHPYNKTDTMKPIIEAVPKELIERELTEERLLRATNNAGNFIYTIKAAEAPDIMREIGRLRELAFRQAGGGTGNEVDVDEQDLAPDGYTQLFVWDPVAREILGGYRYIICDSPYPKNLSTEHYFRFSDRFRQEVLPYTIELGRSFVQPRYQRTRDAKSSMRSTTCGTDSVR